VCPGSARPTSKDGGNPHAEHEQHAATGRRIAIYKAKSAYQHGNHAARYGSTDIAASAVMHGNNCVRHHAAASIWGVKGRAAATTVADILKTIFIWLSSP
jgi:hypothetical protein